MFVVILWLFWSFIQPVDSNKHVYLQEIYSQIQHPYFPPDIDNYFIIMPLYIGYLQQSFSKLII